MNRLEGTIREIKSCEGITQIFVAVGDEILSSLILSGDEEYRAGENVHLLFKETEVMIATPDSVVSARNAFVSSITHVEYGEILAQVSFDFDGKQIVAVITKGALDALGCREGDGFLWFVKSNEISIQKG